VSAPKYATGDVVWKGRPSISVYLMLYGILAAIGAAILVGLEVYAGDSTKSASSVFFASFKGIPDLLEIATVLIILVVYLVKVVRLVIFKARHEYELRTDGININTGIANLSNTFISAMAFSDAKLIRTLGMRIVGRSTIILEANDGRKFEMKMLKDAANVQSLIRNNLSHPTVRLEK
jgi:hypothetical protein